MASLLQLVALTTLWHVPAPTEARAAPPPAELEHQRWAAAAFQLTISLNCSAGVLTSPARCELLQLVERRRSVVYLAERPAGASLVTVLPDGQLSAPADADAVLVIDPFPEAAWGHLVSVFTVQRHHVGPKCGPFGGIKLETGECIAVAVKSRCLNQLESQYHLDDVASRCQLNFLPEVRLRAPAEPADGEPRNLLSCRPLAGFGSCPRLRPLADTQRLLCDPSGANHHRCDTTHFVETRCRLMETCDQAVLLSGGWNRLHSDQRSRLNVLHMYRMLKHSGFRKHNIKVFFANGRDNVDGEDESYPHTYLHPSAMKLGLRYHLRKMCAEPHCVDSLVFYLNSPAADDGSTLLWDADGDGIASHHERYRVAELLSDLESCAARQVLLLVDQSFSGRIVRAMAGSPNHANVQVVAAAGPDEYSWGGEFTRVWSQTNHSRTCTRTVSKSLKTAVFRSHPESISGPEVPPALTLFGAPCDAHPALTAAELERDYRGCQNVRLTEWVHSHASRPHDTSLDRLVEESATRRRRADHRRR
ncbi:uncharacterized protein LOC122384327 [Amphibalanus amphitrite]|uniref:uncharacterized protein LOC122384327 n=1 Tax=Amphibalanus amphitrite TaxID=1232801 RepID=UPI001C9290A0|nr:uncharacterized protein LOC122384327 [Amphibalanus amphitrite]